VLLATCLLLAVARRREPDATTTETTCCRPTATLLASAPRGSPAGAARHPRVCAPIWWTDT